MFSEPKLPSLNFLASVLELKYNQLYHWNNRLWKFRFVLMILVKKKKEIRLFTISCR